MKRICRNCHFLSKEYRDPSTGNPLVFSLTEREREKAESAPSEVVATHYALNCHMGIWDEGVSGSTQDRDTIINRTLRSRSCFFIPHRPAMLYTAAKELQKREAEHENMRRSNRYTRIGLYVAAGALCVNAIVQYFKS
jgi:hypothetical protein